MQESYYRSNQRLIEVTSKFHKEYLKRKNIDPVNVDGDTNIYHVSDLIQELNVIKLLSTDYKKKEYIKSEVDLFLSIENEYEK